LYRYIKALVDAPERPASAVASNSFLESAAQLSMFYLDRPQTAGGRGGGFGAVSTGSGGMMSASGSGTMMSPRPTAGRNRGGGLYKFWNPVETHSLKAPGFGFNLLSL
jgi:hypothetical protein